MRRALLCSLLILAASPLLAWGEKGHYLSNEAATFGVPNDMPLFFYKAYPELVFLAYDPDRWRGAGESLDAVNFPDHFLDYEYVARLDLPPDRYKFINLLYTSGTLHRYDITNSTSGFLPWRIAELSELLTSEFRQWRFAPRGSRERDFIEQDIIHIAGVLGHYAGDAANPEHTTTNYNGWLDANPNRYPTDCEAHERFETAFVSRNMSIEDVTPLLAAPKARTDYFGAALEFIRGSNALVENLYRIDRDGGFNTFRPATPATPEAKAFTAARLAAGASFLRDLWWSAWKNSATRPPRRR